MVCPMSQWKAAAFLALTPDSIESLLLCYLIECLLDMAIFKLPFSLLMQMLTIMAVQYIFEDVAPE